MDVSATAATTTKQAPMQTITVKRGEEVVVAKRINNFTLKTVEPFGLKPQSKYRHIGFEEWRKHMIEKQKQMIETNNQTVEKITQDPERFGELRPVPVKIEVLPATRENYEKFLKLQASISRLRYIDTEAIEQSIEANWDAALAAQNARPVLAAFYKGDSMVGYATSGGVTSQNGLIGELTEDYSKMTGRELKEYFTEMIGREYRVYTRGDGLDLNAGQASTIFNRG